MSKYCTSCGEQIEDSCNYCTQCGTLTMNKERFTYNNKSENNANYGHTSYYDNSAATNNYGGKYNASIGGATTNVRYSKLVKYMNASFAIGVGVVIAFVAMLVWISIR